MSLFTYLKNLAAADKAEAEEAENQDAQVDESQEEATEETADSEEATEADAEGAEEGADEEDAEGEAQEDAQEEEAEEQAAEEAGANMSADEIRCLAELGNDAGFAMEALAAGMDFAQAHKHLTKTLAAKLEEVQASAKAQVEEANDRLETVAKAGELEAVSTEGNKAEGAEEKAEGNFETFQASVAKQINRINKN